MTSTYFRSKIALRCGTRMSFKLVRKPHMKNSMETIAIAPRAAEVSGAFARTDGVSVTVAAGSPGSIAIGHSRQVLPACSKPVGHEYSFSAHGRLCVQEPRTAPPSLELS